MDIAAQAATTPAASNGKADRSAVTAYELRTLRRSLVRALGLKGRPSAYIATLANQAAMATILAEQSLSDPHISADDRVRTAGMARRARRELEHAAGAKPPTDQPLSLKELLRG